MKKFNKFENILFGLFIVFTLIGLFVVRSVYVNIKSTAIKTTHEELEFILKTSEKSLNDFVEYSLSSLEILANIKSVKTLNKNAKKIIEEFYNKLNEHSNALDHIIITDTSGDIKYTFPEDIFIGFNIGHNKFFKSVIKSKKYYVGNICQFLNGKSVFTISVPVFSSDNKIKYVLSYLIRNDYFYNDLKNFSRFVHNSSLFVIDKNGKIVFSNNKTEIGADFYQVPKYYSRYSKIFKDIKNHNKKYLILKHNEHRTYLFLEPFNLHGNKWGLIVEVPSESLFRDIYNKTAVFIFIIAFLFISLLFAFYLRNKYVKKHLEMLSDKEEKFHIISNITGQVIFESDIKSDTVKWYCAVDKLLGYDKELYENMNRKKIYELMHPDDYEETTKKLEEVFNSNDKFFSVEYRLKHSNGHYVYMKEMALIIREKGKAVKLIGSLQDITILKQQEKEIENFRHNLEMLINQRTKALEVTLEQLRKEIEIRKQKEIELEKAKKKVEEALKLKSEFLAQMSHEIRTPINTIIGHSSLLRMELEDEISEDLMPFFRAINSAGQRIIRTVELILNVSELQTGSYHPIFEQKDIYKEILKKIYLQLLPQAQEKKLEMKLSESDNVKTFAVVDEYSVKNIFINIIENSIIYTEQGTIDISVFRNEEDKLCVKISDTGIGISKEYIPHIYEPFSQEQGGYAREYEGNGLGLTLVKKYCDLNNIKIQLDSIKGKGTTFLLIFEGDDDKEEK